MPSASNQPFTSFPANFTTLPTISFVIPNLLSVADQTMRWWLYPLFAKAVVMASEWLQPLVSMVRSITVSPTRGMRDDN